MSEAQRVGVYGASGSGKSTWAMAYLKSRKFTRVLIFDQTGEYSDLRGYKQVSPSRNEADLVAAVRGKSWKIVYQAKNPRSDLHRVSVVLRAAADAVKGGLIGFYVEELAAAFPSTRLPDDLSGFGDLCARGRHYGIELIGVSQRVAGVGNDFRGNTNVAVVFRPGNSAADISTSKDLVPQDFKSVIGQLQAHEYVKTTGFSAERGKNKPLRRRAKS